MLHPGPSSCLQAFGHQAITVPADRHPVGDPAHERTVLAGVAEGEQQPLTVIAALQKSTDVEVLIGEGIRLRDPERAGERVGGGCPDRTAGERAPTLF